MFRVIFHLDMDAFYASIEQREDPSLRGKAVIVGAPPEKRGVVCAASYEARKYGVRSALPSSTAKRLCPHGVFIRPRMDHYKEESKTIMELVRQAGALIEQVSIDEAYLDFSSQCQGSSADQSLQIAVPVARVLKQSIREQRQLTASIGIASNKFLAKLGSDYEKPDGLTVIREQNKADFLRPLPVRIIHGVGKVTEQILQKAGISTVGDLQSYPGDLRHLVGSFGPVLKQFSLGEDDRPLDLSDEVKSISSENTFEKDTEDRSVLRKCLREQAEEIEDKLRKRHLGARTIQVKVRYSDFSTLTRQLSLEDPMTDARDIYRLGCLLLARDHLVNRPLRLLGIGVSNFTDPIRRQLEFPLGS